MQNEGPRSALICCGCGTCTALHCTAVELQSSEGQNRNVWCWGGVCRHWSDAVHRHLLVRASKSWKGDEQWRWITGSVWEVPHAQALGCLPTFSVRPRNRPPAVLSVPYSEPSSVRHHIYLKICYLSFSAGSIHGPQADRRRGPHPRDVLLPSS